MLLKIESSSLKALDDSPECLDMIIRLANESKNFTRADGSKAGVKKSAGLDALFCHLASIYFSIFGEPPCLNSDRYSSAGDDMQASLLWATYILRLANARAYAIAKPQTIDRQPLRSVPVVSLLFEATRLKGATKADRQRNGWITWTRLPAAEQWPVHQWWPWGCDPSGAVVPKWLQNLEISTPR